MSSLETMGDFTRTLLIYLNLYSRSPFTYMTFSMEVHGLAEGRPSVTIGMFKLGDDCCASLMTGRQVMSSSCKKSAEGRHLRESSTIFDKRKFEFPSTPTFQEQADPSISGSSSTGLRFGECIRQLRRKSVLRGSYSSLSSATKAWRVRL